MKRYLFFLLGLGVMHSVAKAQVLMRDIFGSMPDSVLTILTKNNRLDCIDFIENNIEAKVRNRFDGYSVLKELNTDYLKMQLTPTCIVEMKLLPMPDSTSVIGVVQTLDTVNASSSITFYSPSWQRLNTASIVDVPLYADYWHTADSIDAEEIERLQHLHDIRFVKAMLSPVASTLTFQLLPGLVDDKEKENIEKATRPIVFEWSAVQGKFVAHRL